MELTSEMVRGLIRRSECDREERLDRVMNALERTTWIFLNIAAATIIVLAVVL